MKTVKICLNSIEKVKSFVNAITRFDVDFDLVSGRYVIDAKSIMGIFSLDLSKPIDLNIHANEEMDAILEVLKPYIIEYSQASYTYKRILRVCAVRNLSGLPGRFFIFLFSRAVSLRGRGPGRPLDLAAQAALLTLRSRPLS